MVDTKVLISLGQIAAAVYFVEDDTIMSHPAKNLQSFRSVQIGDTAPFEFNVGGKKTDFTGIVVAVKTGINASARVRTLVKDTGNKIILLRRGRIWARKLHHKLVKSLDPLEYENVDWQDEAEQLNETVVEEPEHPLDASLNGLAIETTNSSSISYSKYQKLKRKLEAVEEACEAFTTEAGEKFAKLEQQQIKLEALLEAREAEKDQLKSLVEKIQVTISQQNIHGGSGSRQFTTRTSVDDTVEQLVDKYLAAGITNWRDAAGKYLTEVFSLEELGSGCPTVEGEGQAVGKKALDPERIQKLRDMVACFVKTNNKNSESAPKKGMITGRIHGATRGAREKLAARQIFLNTLQH